MNQYYTLPIDFGKLISNRKHPTCENLKESVEQNIHLILITHFGEYRNDPTYGCSVWDEDFEILPSVSTWKDKIESSIKMSVQQHESRLYNIKVKVDIDPVELVSLDEDRSKHMKKRINIKIMGTIMETNEAYEQQEQIYFLSLIHI